MLIQKSRTVVLYPYWIQDPTKDIIRAREKKKEEEGFYIIIIKIYVVKKHTEIVPP